MISAILKGFISNSPNHTREAKEGPQIPLCTQYVSCQEIPDLHPQPNNFTTVDISTIKTGPKPHQPPTWRLELHKTSKTTPRLEHFLQKCSLQPIGNGWLFGLIPFREVLPPQNAMISLIAFYQDLQDLTRQCPSLCLLFTTIVSGLGISSLPSGAGVSSGMALCKDSCARNVGMVLCHVRKAQPPGGWLS